MKNKIKKILKDVVIVWTVICTLLPTLCTGLAFAADEGKLNTERAGNYVANFAINFYENWSSINEDGTYQSNGTAQNVLDAGQQIYDEILLGNYNINYVAMSGRDSEKIVTDRSYSEAHGMDCSTFVSAALWLAGFDQFASTTNTWGLEAGCTSGDYVRDGFEVYKTDGTRVYQFDDSGNTSVLAGVRPVDILQPGDVIVINRPDGTNGHTNIVKSVTPNNTNKYVALDCGSASSWQNVDRYRSSGGGTVWDIWTSVNWHRYGNATQAYLIRALDANGRSISVGTYGTIKTQYNEGLPFNNIVNESDSIYEFSNKSWISFVYHQALFKENPDGVNKVFTGAGTNPSVSATNFDDKHNIEKISDVANDSPILDISRLISEGKVLPGDILYVNKGDGTYEYLLNVGGSKVIYATNDEAVGPSGALKYEYLEYYLRRIRRKLREGHENDEDFVLPKYGVTEIYRIKKDVAEAIDEKDANLFFNGKGYYSKVTYDGIPVDIQLYETGFNFFKWLFEIFKRLLELLLNLIIYMIRMQVIGWANLFENLMQYVLLGITGDNNTTGWDALFGTSATSASGGRVTVESIFFNRIPILDANFFNYEEAGGRPLTIEREIVGPLRPGESRTVVEFDQDNVAYRLRRTLATIYIVLRNASIAILLFILIAVGIRIALTSIADKKAQYKQFLTSWLYAMCVVLFIHIFMYTVFWINDTFVGICEDWNKKAAAESVKEIIMNTNSDEELSLYDAVRVKAYAFNWKEGVPATIVYIFLIYLLIRFSFIYFKRYLTIYILALSSSFMGVKYAIDRLLGKKTSSLNKWFKDFAFNVLLQTVHALIYTLFMAIAISVSAESVGGALTAVVILNFMLQADKIIIKVFGLDKAGSLADVNRPESYRELFHRFLPIWTISRGMAHLGKNAITGDQGFIRRKLDIVFAHNAKTISDANKIWTGRKFKLIGWAATPLDFAIKHTPLIGAALDKHLPIRHLKMLKDDLSYDTKKQYYNDIKGYVKQEVKRFTRPISTIKDLTLGTAGTVASLGVMISSPQAGLTLLMGSRRLINKHKSMNRVQMRHERYTGRKGKAREMRDSSAFDYKVALNTYTAHEMTYQEEYNKLLDDYATAAAGSKERQEAEDKIKELRKERKRERARELHALQEADEKLTEAKIAYGNAKHEKNPKTRFGKIRQHDREAFQKVTGITGIENIAMSESRASFETRDSAKKIAKKLDDMQKAAEEEKNLRKLAAEFKEEIYNMEVDGKKLTKEEADSLFDQYMSQTVREASNLSVKSSVVTNAVKDILIEKKSDKVEPHDIDDVIDKVRDGLYKAGKKTVISDAVKREIKDEMEKQMINDNKGLGLEDKVAAEIIRKILGKKGNTEVKKSKAQSAMEAKMSDSAKATREQLLNTLVQIHTYNDVAKIKHKSELIKDKKVVKDAKKKKVGGK